MADRYWVNALAKSLIVGCLVLYLGDTGIGSSMESAEKAARERASKTLVAYMSLEVMFPSPDVRALASAAAQGKLEEVDRILSRGVDINYRGNQNATPLFWSMRNLSGYTHLLERGADPNVVFADGGSVMHWAARADDPQFLAVALRHEGNPNLIAGRSGETPLFDAIGSSPVAINLLLDAGADINATSTSGDTAAMIAAGLGRFDVVYLLLSRGADFTIRNRNGVSLVDRVRDNVGAMDPSHELALWLDKVVAWLCDRGVEIPDCENAGS